MVEPWIRRTGVQLWDLLASGQERHLLCVLGTVRTFLPPDKRDVRHAHHQRARGIDRKLCYDLRWLVVVHRLLQNVHV